jgi:predicted ATPase/DNA-binding CsgD family transcriptional regulator
VFVPLQSVADAARVPFALAEALGVALLSDDPPEAQLIRYLHARNLLLVIDNFEQVLPAADTLVRLLGGAPDLKMLVTSREILNIGGEYVYEVGGLAYASDDDDALRLFATRAAQNRHDFDLARERADAIRICRLVEGMPLALELAAAWVKVLPCSAIADEMTRSLDFLATTQRDLPPRHRSIRAAFDQSWARLDSDLRRVFAALGVFKGGFTRAAAAQVAGATAPALSALVDHSLLRFDGALYSLHELLRVYALDRVEDVAALTEQHALYYMGLLRDLDRPIKSAGQIAACDAIEAEYDNVRAAWDWALAHGRADLLRGAYECLALYHQMRCRLGEAQDLFSRAAEAFVDHADRQLYGWLLLCELWFNKFGDTQKQNTQRQIAQSAFEILHEYPLNGAAAMLLSGYFFRSEYQIEPFVVANEAAYRAQGDHWGIGWSLEKLALFDSHVRHDENAARLKLEASLAAFAQAGDGWGATWAQGFLGLMDEAEGAYQAAYEIYSARLAVCQAVRDAGGIAWTLQQLAIVSLELDDKAKALYYGCESLRVALDISETNSVGEAVLRFASIYTRQGDIKAAATLYAAMAEAGDAVAYQRGQAARLLDELRLQLPPDWAAPPAVSLRQLGQDLLATTCGSMAGDVLTERETEIVRLLARGLSNREIAAQLVVSLGTVKKHLNNIFGKLDAGSRTQALARARELGIT